MDADRHLYRTFACTACGYIFKAPISCGNRFCSVCSTPRRRRAAQKLRFLVTQIRPPAFYTFKHLTLTIRNGSDLDVMYRSLLCGFRRLRQHRLWKSKVRGGAFILELTGQPGNWHLHLHAIIEARYVPWSLLHDQWQKVSTGHGVWIATRPPGVILNYLTSYLTKNQLPPESQKQAAHALRNARLFQTFGVWHNLTVTLPKVNYPCPKCGDCSYYPLDLLEIINRIGYLPRRRRKEVTPSC